MNKPIDDLEEIRKGLRELSLNAMELRKQLILPKDDEPLKHALESILGNVEIAIKEGKHDADLLPWIVERIKGVLPNEA